MKLPPVRWSIESKLPSGLVFTYAPNQRDVHLRPAIGADVHLLIRILTSYLF